MNKLSKKLESVISLKFFLLVVIVSLIFFNFFDIFIFQLTRSFHGSFFSFFKEIIDPLSDILDPLYLMIICVIIIMLIYNIKLLLKNSSKLELMELKSGLKKDQIIHTFSYYSLVFKHSLVSFIAAGIACNILKYIIGVARPKYYFLKNYDRVDFFNIEHKVNSFPSGHTQAAFTLAILLIIYINRFYFIIITVAILMGLSRIFMSMHFPSDIIFGAYVGSFIPIILYKLYFQKSFDRVELRNTTKFQNFLKLLYWRISI